MTPKQAAAVNWVMRSIRRNRRGLAEIVGTLMLVVIVVAAATAFAFFVAAYEKQILAEENQQHLVSEEKIRIVGITVVASNPHWRPYSAPSYLNVSIASEDLNTIVPTNYEVNGVFALGWYFNRTGGSVEPCTSAGATNDLANCSLSSYGSGVVTLPYAPDGGPIHLVIGTSLANDFTYLFFPPVAIVKVTLLPIGNATVPLFDGSASYQPAGGDNASIASYSWQVNNPNGSSGDGNYSGPEVELSSLELVPSGSTYQVTLTVTNTDGLVGSAMVIYRS